MSDVVRSVPDGTEIELLVSPRSNRAGPEGFDEWRKRLIFRVKAPPLDGRANKEIESHMKDITGFKSEVIRGHTDRQKTVLVFGPEDQVSKALEDYQ